MSPGQLSQAGKVSVDPRDSPKSPRAVAVLQQASRRSAETRRCSVKEKGRKAWLSTLSGRSKSCSASEIHLAVMSRSRSGDLLEIDLHARSHRRADAELVHELAFRARRSGLDDGVDKG